MTRKQYALHYRITTRGKEIPPKAQNGSYTLGLGKIQPG